ncbi:MAG: hypothetical protein EB015_20635 [Methylocystaceae bacterium]|nr:hypothetical protein [Methylocystaceae bacterium]
MPIPEIDEALNRFVLSCLDKDPSQRQLNIGMIGESLGAGGGSDGDRTIRIPNDQTVKLSNRKVAMSGTATTGGEARTIPSGDQVTSTGPAFRMIGKYLSLPKSARLALFIFLVAFSLKVTVSSMSGLTILATSAGIRDKAYMLVSRMGDLFLSGFVAWYIYKVCAKSTHLAGLAKECCAVALGLVIPLSFLLIDPPAAFLTSFLPGASTSASAPQTGAVPQSFEDFKEMRARKQHELDPYLKLLETAQESKSQLLLHAPVDQKAVMNLDTQISALKLKSDNVARLQAVISRTKHIAESVSLGSKYLGSDSERDHNRFSLGPPPEIIDCASLDGALPGQCAAALAEYAASVRKLVELRIKLQIPCPKNPFERVRNKKTKVYQNWAWWCSSITSDVLRK